MHRTSASSAVKSLRWLAKHIQWAALQACVRNSLVASYCKQIASFDKREATPLPAALVAAWERILCAPHAPLTTKLILGAALLCIHSSIRFGDAQRVRWHTLQLSTQGLHAVAYATKTTKAGQPFACTWHGYTGRSASTSWLLRWLACISSLPAFQQDASNQPDFLFPHADMQCHALPCIAPASYARTLLCIRWASQSADICGQAALTPGEASALTLHSMKSTALASAAQLHLRRDERLAQGHHRDSARHDTFASLHVQRAIATSLATGWRPQRSMARGSAPPIPEPPVSIATALPPEHLPASDIVSGPWSAFASRREHMQASRGTEQAPGEDPQAPNSPPASPDSPVLLQLQASSDDEEARQVEEWAQQHASSDSASEAPEQRHHLEQLFVCSGPWGSMHSPTPESLAAYNTSAPEQGKPAVRLLKAACGAKLGAASFAISCTDPLVPCRRQGCLQARPHTQQSA